jgi:hypothetical protein
MIADKEKVETFLRKLDLLCKKYGANIKGNVAFFDDGEWGDWLALECNGELSTVKSEETEEFSPEEKLEEMHRDMLLMRSDLLTLTEIVLKKNKK